MLQRTLLVFIRSTPPQHYPLCSSVRYVLTQVVSRCLLPHVKQPTLSLLIQLKPSWHWFMMISFEQRFSNKHVFYPICCGSIAEFSLNRTPLSLLPLLSVFFFPRCAGWAWPHRETQRSHVRPACREEVADLLQQKEGRSITAAGCRWAANIKNRSVWFAWAHHWSGKQKAFASQYLNHLHFLCRSIYSVCIKLQIDLDNAEHKQHIITQ